MSANGYPATSDVFNSKAFLIGLHADHRPQDVFFARTQSQAFRDAEWEVRVKPLQSWGQFVLWGLAILMFVISAASIVG
jgi:hypothetical protein